MAVIIVLTVVAVLLFCTVFVLTARLTGRLTKERARAAVSSHFTAPRIAYMAVFTALAFVISLWEIPVFPAADYLKLDFANVFFLIEGFIFGPVEAVVSIGVKELLCLTMTSSGGVGQLANFLMSAAYIAIPATLYRFKKGRGWVVVYLLFACIMQIGISLPVNRFINFPFYMHSAAGEVFAAVWPYVVAFNAIKSVAVSLIVFLLYKPLARFIRMTGEKFEKRRKKQKTA